MHIDDVDPGGVETVPAQPPPSLWTAQNGVMVALGLVLYQMKWNKVAYALWGLTGADMIARQMNPNYSGYRSCPPGHCPP